MIMPPPNKNRPAYPSEEVDDGDGTVTFNPGLTKRELFAAMAMQGWCAANPNYGGTVEDALKITAKASVAVADALLAELEKKS